MKPTFQEIERIAIPLFGKNFTGNALNKATKEEVIAFVTPILEQYEWTFDEFFVALKDKNQTLIREDRNRRKKLRKERKAKQKGAN